MFDLAIKMTVFASAVVPTALPFNFIHFYRRTRIAFEDGQCEWDIY